MTIKKYNLLILILISILSPLLLSISIAADSAVEKKADIEKTDTVIEGTVEKLPGKIQPAWMKISVSGEFGPISNEIQDLAIGPSGSLWVATNRGLSRLSGGKFRHFTRKNGMPHDQVFTVISGKRGVFAGTKGGLVWFDDLAPSKEISPEIVKGIKGAVTSIFECENDFVFLISPQYENSRIGILTLNPDRRPPEILLRIYKTNTKIRRLLPVSRNRLYCQVPDRKWIQVELPENPESLVNVTLGNISDLSLVDVVSIGNEKLILTEDKLLRQTGSQSPQPLPVPDDKDNTDGFLAHNRDGTGIWFGKKNNLWLLNSLTGEKLRYFKLPQGVATKNIAEEPNGRLWVGTENNGLFMSGSSSWSIVSIPSKKTTSIPSEGLGTLSEALELMDRIGKEQSPILIDFTNERQVLVSEMKDILTHYDEDNPNTCMSWQLIDEDIVDILGGKLSFVATNKNIYMLYDNKLMKFIDKGKLLDETTETLTRYEKYLSVKSVITLGLVNMGLDTDEIPDDNKWEELYRKFANSYLLTTDMNSFISKPNHDVKELVTLSSDKSGGVVLYSKRFSRKGTISNHLTHVPETTDISLMIPVHETESFLFLKNNNDLLQIDKNLSIERVSVPKTVSNNITDIIFHEAPNNTGSIFLLERKGLWQKKNNDRWKRKPFASDKDAFIFGLLPDKDGGVMVAEQNLSLLRLSEDGKISTYTTQLILKDPAAGDNALLLDMKGNVWLGATNSLFFVEYGRQELIPVQEFQDMDTNAIIEYFSRIIVTGYKIGICIIENGNIPRKVSNIKGYTLTKFPIKKSGEEHVWVGGYNIFSYLDKELTGKSVSHLEKLKDALGDVYIDVKDLESVRNFLFVATNRGLVKLTLETNNFLVTKIDLPEYEITSDNDMTILVRHNGKIIIASYLGKKSKLWQGAPEDNQFQLIAETDFDIDVLAETAKNEVLIGGKGFQIYTLKNNQVVPYRNLKENYIPADLKSLAVLGNSEFIILAGKETPFDLYRVRFNENTNSSKVNLLNLKTNQWKQNIKISDSQLLLLNQDNTISLLKLGDNPKVQNIDLKEKIYQLNEKSKKIYLLGNRHIWIYKPDENKPKILLPLPSTEKTGPPQEMNFSIDNQGIWLSTKQNGLWRYDKKWIPFYETDGLPSKRIETVASLNDKEAIVITQAGPCKAKKDNAGYWQFFPPENPPGISGKEVRKASLFQLDNALTLALATDKGITFVRWPEDDWDKKKFSHIDQDSVLLDNNVTALHWHEPEKELWTGSGGGVIALKLATDSDGSAKVEKTTLTLTANQGLPRSEVTEITTSSSKDGNKTAWILTKNAITRWYKDNEKDQLVNTEPFFLAHAQDAKLGPSVDGQPPQLLIQDKDYNWSVWNPGTSIYPRLSVKESLFFWYHAQLKIDSLDPALEDLKKWNVEYRIDGTDQPPLIRPWGLLLDIRTDTGPHYILATIKSRNNPTIQYRTSFPIPRATSQYRTIRLITLFTVIIFIAVSLFWYAKKLRIRAVRLRTQDIPYIQGPAIKDPSQFFGREKLLKKLRNTIITTNYALVGEFRIGKTSIQFQLNDLLKSFENSKHTFLPVFLDLHLVDPPKEKHFFHFLGEHLINLAQEQNIPPDILSEFHFRQTQSSEKYTSMHFKNDLECLLDQLQEKFPDRPPVIVFQIDEIPLITDFDTLGKLRAILVREPRFRAVLSGKNIPKDTELDLVSPWWNIFTEIEVEPLTPSEARKLITEPVQGLFQFDEKAIDHIIGRAQGKPLSIQTMCADLLHYKYSTGKFTTRITEEDLYASIDFSSEKRRNEKREAEK
ncbi:MAG: hypothetical protein GY795_10180 [Desulfobacterales bacterium]|nr:hypothetical protein [Desulfobacterales bacterium]